MANTNTLAGLYNVPAFVNPTAESAFPAVSGGLIRAFVGVRPDIALAGFDGKPFRVRCVGRVTGGAAGNITVALRFNSGANTNLTTFTGDTAVATTAAKATGGAAGNFLLEATMLWDSVSLTVNGYQSSFVDGVALVAPASLTASLSAVASVGALQFFPTAIFSVSNAANTISIAELSIEQV